jgi:sugar phosphate isomerase/epimerase
VSELDVPSGLPARLPTPAPGDPRLARLSLNQRTTQRWSVGEAVEGCLAAGIPAIGLWREQIAEYGLDRSCRAVANAGLRVSSVCRGGFLTGLADDHARAMRDNTQAIDEAAALGASCLVMVVGGLPEGSRDLPGARRRVEERVAELAVYAGENGVRLALEPMHPLFCADRGVISTLRQAIELAERFPAEQVGVVIDTFHVWWDPDLTEVVGRAAGRIASYQVCDWITPFPADALLSRGMMGDGHIDFRAVSALVEQAGYTGDIEVEIFNAEVWAAEPASTVATMARRYVEHVLPGDVRIVSRSGNGEALGGSG